MTERSVGSVAQDIVSMSDEERQALAIELSSAGVRIPLVNEIPHTPPTSHNLNERKDSSEETVTEKPINDDDSAYSFLRLAQSLNLEGPADWSANVDHYLYGTPKVEDD